MGDIALLESVQRSFTRRMPGLQDLLYFERLRKLELCTLEKRRLFADLILCYKIVRGLIPGPVSDCGLQLSPTSITRGHEFKLQIQFSSCNSHKYSFGRRIAIVWNSLKTRVVLSSSVNQLKKHVKKLIYINFCILEILKLTDLAYRKDQHILANVAFIGVLQRPMVILLFILSHVSTHYY